MAMPLALSAVQPSHLASLILDADPANAAEDWVRLCMRFTPRVEQVSVSRGLLDLGASALPEVRQRMAHLLALLAQQGTPARVGVGPTSTLAQLALLMAPHDTRLTTIAVPQVPSLLRRAPVHLLIQIHPFQTLLGAEVIASLERYGLRTLDQLGRLEARALCQQFGDQVGRVLTALAQGEDLYPVQTTPSAHWHRVRLRWVPALDPLHAEQAILAVPRLTKRATVLLDGHAAGALRVGVRWASGTGQMCHAMLRERSADARQLCQVAERLLRRALTQARSAGAADDMARDGNAGDLANEVADGIEELCLWLGACAAKQSTQTTFWRTWQQRQEAIRVLAESLARQHGRPLLVHSRPVAPAAIFAENRYVLLPTAPVVPVGQGRGRPHSGAGGAITHHADTHHAEGDSWDQVPQRLHWW